MQGLGCMAALNILSRGTGEVARLDALRRVITRKLTVSIENAGARPQPGSRKVTQYSVEEHVGAGFYWESITTSCRRFRQLSTAARECLSQGNHTKRWS